MHSVDKSYFKIMVYLLNNGINIHYGGDYILNGSVINGYVEIIKYLINNNVDVSKIKDYALNYCIVTSNLEMIMFLLNNGIDIKRFEKLNNFDIIKNKIRKLKLNNIC